MIREIVNLVCTIGNKIRFLGKARIPFSCVVKGKTKFEGDNHVGPGTYINNCYLGFGSGLGKECFFSSVSIGRFSSIGDNVRVVSATHPLGQNVSTHPAFYNKNQWPKGKVAFSFDEYLVTKDGLHAKIGSDVWIGSNVLIKGGITIGDGAVVGMGSIVTKDVPPFAVVAGVPARIIRYRFTAEQIKTILEKPWWDQSLEWIEQHVASFGDIQQIIDALND